MRTGDPVKQKGAAAVEMAFATLLLIWLVLGVVDVGRAIITDIGLKEAVQAGAHHFAFTETATGADAETVAVASTETPTLAAGDITATCFPVTRNGQNYGTVTVSATHDLELITPIVGAALGGTIELSEIAEAERYFPCP